MKATTVALFVVVAALGLSSCLGDEDWGHSWGYPSYPSYGYGKGYGKGYEETIIRAPYAVPFPLPPTPPMGNTGFDGGLFGGEGTGLIFLFLFFWLFLNNSSTTTG